jgi:CRP-like cAMP-binding protein
VTATAREPSTVIRIPRSLFLKMLEGYPDAAERLREDILRRAEDSSRDISKVRGVLDAVDIRH